MTDINKHFKFGRVNAPPQWKQLLTIHLDLCATKEPAPCEFRRGRNQFELNKIVRFVERCTYTPDQGRDKWRPDMNGDCEDKCLYLLREYQGHKWFNSMRLAICKLHSGQDHAVLLFYTTDGTKVIDPTLSTMIVPWEIYPVEKWIIRHSHGYLWENFKDA